ncbi:glycolipid 2-alpha-mannosyltransferase-domain-containing protein [Mycena sanguinolenta]|nr:glycolipid 2-alpha-mannosyltransferase-domain-containing protein [Mycena sanguinolenta]
MIVCDRRPVYPSSSSSTLHSHSSGRMITQLRYVFIALAVLISLHYILSFTNESYGNATSLDNLKEQFTDSFGGNPPDKNVIPPSYDSVDVPPMGDDYYHDDTGATGKSSADSADNSSPPHNAASTTPVPEDYYAETKPTTSSPRKANAAFVMLARNGDLDGAVITIKQMEDRFNKRYNYSYVLLNEEPFTDHFKSRITALTDSPVQFGLIPSSHWFQPDWIDGK